LSFGEGGKDHCDRVKGKFLRWRMKKGFKAVVIFGRISGNNDTFKGVDKRPLNQVLNVLSSIEIEQSFEKI